MQPPPNWTIDEEGTAMSREVRCEDFLDAVALVNAIAPVAEALNHHPDLHLERYNRLRITTWSHDVGGLTERDVRLAERLNELLDARAAEPSG